MIARIGERLFTAAFFFCLYFSVHSQAVTNEAAVSHYTKAQKRLLVSSTAAFIHLQTQDMLDEDSVMSMACTLTGLPFLTPYTSGRDEKSEDREAKLINEGKIAEATRHLQDVDREKRLQLLLQLATWYIHQPGNQKMHLDSANHFIQDALRLNFIVRDKKSGYDCLHLLAEYYRQNGNETEGKNIFLQMIAMSQMEGDKETTADSWYRLAQLHQRMDSSDLAYLQKALVAYQQLQLKEKAIESLWQIARYHRTNDLRLFQNDLIRILEIQRSTDYKHSLFAEHFLSYVYAHSGNYPQALLHANAAIENMNWSHMVAVQGTFYMQLGIAYEKMGRNEDALSSFRKGLENRSGQTQIFWINSLISAMTLLCDINQPSAAISLMTEVTSQFPPVTPWGKAQIYATVGHCRARLNDYTSANDNYMAFLEVVNKNAAIEPCLDFLDTYKKIARFYLSVSNLAAARVFVNKVTTGSGLLGSDAEKNDILFKLDSVSGNTRSTIAGKSSYRFSDYYVLYKSLADAEKKIAQRQEFEQLNIQYATEKEKNDISLLKKEKELQDTLLLQEKYRRNWIMGGMGLLLIILGLLVYNARLKQRTNVKLKRQRQEIEEHNDKLRHLVNEKEWLVKEIHHRVKNNLQFVISLLNAQSSYIDNDAARSAIHDSQHRVHAMSLIHQKLYNVDSFSSIDISLYIRELVSYLVESFGVGQRILFDLDIERLDMDVSQAVPFGLILNETITNSLKYAFPDGKRGLISIKLSKVDHEHYLLVITDNGIGLPYNFMNKKPGSLGMTLIAGLSEDLDGELSIENHDGTSIKITFTHTPVFKRNELKSDDREIRLQS